MRKSLFLLLLIGFSMGPLAGLAKNNKAGQKGPRPNASAYEHANENARFKRDQSAGHSKQQNADGHKKSTDKTARKTEADSEEEQRRKRSRNDDAEVEPASETPVKRTETQPTRRRSPTHRR